MLPWLHDMATHHHELTRVNFLSYAKQPLQKKTSLWISSNGVPKTAFLNHSEGKCYHGDRIWTQNLCTQYLWVAYKKHLKCTRKKLKFSGLTQEIWEKENFWPILKKSVAKGNKGRFLKIQVIHNLLTQCVTNREWQFILP